MLVESFTVDDGWAKAGIMVRNSLEPNSAHFSIFVTGSSGLYTQYRTCNGCVTTSDASCSTVTDTNIWLRVIKIGNTFVSYYKQIEDENWTRCKAVEMSLAEPNHVGIAVTSHDNTKTGVLDVSDFSADNLPTISPGVDIGSVGIPGSTVQSGSGHLLITGSGRGEHAFCSIFQYIIVIHTSTNQQFDLPFTFRHLGL